MWLLRCQIIGEALHAFIAQTLLGMDRLEAGAPTWRKDLLTVAACQTVAARQPVEFLTKRTRARLTPEPAGDQLQQADFSGPGQVTQRALAQLMEGGAGLLRGRTAGELGGVLAKDMQWVVDVVVLQSGDTQARQLE